MAPVGDNVQEDIAEEASNAKGVHKLEHREASVPGVRNAEEGGAR